MSTPNKNIYKIYIFQVLSVGINFAYSLIIVQQLGAFDYGEYSNFYNSIAFSTLLLGLNLPSVIIFFSVNKKIEPGKLLFSALLFTVSASILLAFILSLSGQLNFSVHIFPGGSNRLLWIFLFCAMFLLIQVNQLLQAFLNSQKQFVPIMIFALICNILSLLFWSFIVFKIIKIHIQSFNLIWGINITVNILVCICGFYLIRKFISVRSFFNSITLSELKAVLGFTVIVYLCNTLQFLSYRLDVWFLNFYTGKSAGGIYSLALSLSQLVLVFPNAVSAILINYFEVEKKRYSIYVALNYARICLYGGIFTALVLSMIYYFAIPFFYGDQFYKAFTISLMLLVAVIPFSLTIIIANLNAGIGFVRINLYATIFILVMVSVLDYCLIPTYGMVGAAFAKIIVSFLGLIFQIIIGHKYYELPWKSMFFFPDFKRIFKVKL